MSSRMPPKSLKPNEHQHAFLPKKSLRMVKQSKMRILSLHLGASHGSLKRRIGLSKTR